MIRVILRDQENVYHAGDFLGLLLSHNELRGIDGAGKELVVAYRYGDEVGAWQAAYGPTGQAFREVLIERFE